MDFTHGMQWVINDYACSCTANPTKYKHQKSLYISLTNPYKK